jgi:hypothetical protein
MWEALLLAVSNASASAINHAQQKQPTSKPTTPTPIDFIEFN